MALSKVVHSRKATGGKDLWTTPRELFDKLDAEFEFLVDGAADETNHLCERYYGPGSDDDDALGLTDWRYDSYTTNSVFLNPPYSQNAAFVAKARAEADAGNALVVLLLPARTDVAWFHKYCWDTVAQRPLTRTEVRFLKGRLKFGDSANSAPFPSMVVVFHPSEPFVLPGE